MGFLTNLIEQTLDQKKEDTMNEANVLASAIKHPDQHPGIKAWAMEKLLGKSPLKGKEKDNFLALMQHMSSTGGSNDAGVDSEIQQPEQSQPQQLSQQQPSASPVQNPVRRGGILGAILDTTGEAQHRREAEQEQQRVSQRDIELSRLRQGEFGAESKIRTQEEIAKEQRQRANAPEQLRIDVNHEVTKAKALNLIENEQDEFEYRRKLVRAQNFIDSGMSKPEAYTRAGLPAYHEAPIGRIGVLASNIDVSDVPEEERVPGISVYKLFRNADGLERYIPDAPKPFQETAAVRSALWVQQHLNDPDPQAQAAAKQMLERANAAVRNAGQQQIDAGTLKFLAERALITGTDPAFGMGNAAAGNRLQFYQTLTAAAAAQGNTTAEMLAKQNMIKTARAEMPKLQVIYSQTLVNENNAIKNFDLLKVLGQRMDRESYQTAIPLLNNWIRSGQIRLSGNASVNNFISNLTVGMTEYAKVVTGQTTGAAVTDSARKETQDLLNRGLSTEAINDWIENAAKPDMQNRTSSYQDEMNRLQDIISQGFGAPGAPAQSPVRQAVPPPTPTPGSSNKVITEALIRANMTANPGATRQQIIDALRSQGYRQP